MKDIQNKATDFALSLAKKFTPNLCLFYSYLYCVGIEFVNAEDAFEEADKRRRQGILADDGTVLDAEKLLGASTGQRMSVTKKDITSIDGIRNRTPVRYDYNGHSHWVVVENGRIVFNSIENSQCVKYGKPVTARIIK